MAVPEKIQMAEKVNYWGYPWFLVCALATGLVMLWYFATMFWYEPENQKQIRFLKRFATFLLGWLALMLALASSL